MIATMLSFSEELSKILAQSNMAIYTLSKNTGIDRRAIYRLKDGTKKPKLSDVSKITKALSVSKEEKDRLWQAYEISVIGEEKYRSRQRTKEFLETLSSIYSNQKENMIMFTKSEFDIPKESITLQGQTNINTFLRNVMSLENSTDGYIYIQTDLSYNFLLSELSFQISCNTSLETKLCVSMSSPDDNLYNDSIFSISKIYPLLLLGENCQAKFIKVNSNMTSLFPYNIVTSNFLVSISQDKKSAVVTKAKSIIDSTKSIFLKVFNKGTDFVTHLDLNETALHTLDSLFKQHKSKKTLLYSMDYEPCVTILADKEILDKAINKESENALELIEMYSKASSNILGSVSYFTLDGLKSFLKTGELFGIPKEYYHILDKELIIRIIKNMYSAYKKGFYKPYLINSSNFNYPKNFRYSGSGTIYDYFFITLTNNDNILNTMSLNESGLSRYFYDFVESLPQTNLVYSCEESMEIIISETEKILNCKIDLDKI